MRTVVTVDDEKHQAAPIAQDAAKQTTDEGGIVYAELDLTQQQQNVPIRHLNEDKTEYAEILYTKSSTEEQQTPKE
ncbi:fasciclin-3 isoform X4 [Apis mellifera carnica]|nr:fasciclin-3 isoform X4 [Apis mellifera carnica]